MLSSELMRRLRDPDAVLTPSEVASLFRVDPKTVSRWATKAKGKLPSIKTPGGHRRFPAIEVRKLYEGEVLDDAGVARDDLAR